MSWPKCRPGAARRCAAWKLPPSPRMNFSLGEAGRRKLPAPPLIGVLAMQGAFAEHMDALARSGAKTRLVRRSDDLVGLDGLVLPGGESTTMLMLLERMGLLDAVKQAISTGLPTLATRSEERR